MYLNTKNRNKITTSPALGIGLDTAIVMGTSIGVVYQMHNKRGLFLIISTVIIISLSFTPSLGLSSNIANAQSSPCDNGKIISSPPSNILPVILIHGYFESSAYGQYGKTYLAKITFHFIQYLFINRMIHADQLKDAGELLKLFNK